MSCECGKVEEKGLEKQKALELAKKFQKENGGVMVFFKCSDYDFTTLNEFNPNGKTEIEYIM